jgi:hypothetical protein
MVLTRDSFANGESGKRGEGVRTKLPKLEVKFMATTIIKKHASTKEQEMVKRQIPYQKVSFIIK